MDLEGIRLLSAVVELGSVHGAAQHLGVARSSLRRRLSKLEGAVGAKLFVSGTDGIALTQVGALVLAEGRQLLEGYARMLSSAKSSKDAPPGSVRVIVPEGLPDGTLIALFSALRDIAPGIHLDLVECDDPLDRLHETFDLMFHFGDPPERGRWFSRVIYRQRLTLLASQAYLDARGRPSTAADLAGHDLLSWQVGRADPKQLPLESGGSVAIEPIFTSRNAQLLHRAAAEGLGILLGNPDPLFDTTAASLERVLEAEVGCEVVYRCLSPLPTQALPGARAVLETIHAFFDAVATVS